jgi:hypothetical protein
MSTQTLDTVIENETATFQRAVAPRPSAPLSGKDRGSPRRPISIGDLHAALPPINRILDRLGKIKRKYGFDFDEVIIIAACGAINFAGAKQELPFAQPANISSIAGYIHVPRETVRRKLQTIESKGFVQRYSGGYLINNMSEWLSLVDLLTPERDA